VHRAGAAASRDVTDERDVAGEDAATASVAQARKLFGRLDIVINKAGFGHFGFIEEITENEVRARLETNLFGTLWVSQAALLVLVGPGQPSHRAGVASIGDISALPSRSAFITSPNGRWKASRSSGAGGRRLRYLRAPGATGRLLNGLERIVVPTLRVPRGLLSVARGRGCGAQATLRRPARIVGVD
jgi:NAD(P)-dependent dehydrogenase (short-subunit alcohol dehydrogenase family)